MGKLDICINCLKENTNPLSGQFCPSCAQLLANKAARLYFEGEVIKLFGPKQSIKEVTDE